MQELKVRSRVRAYQRNAHDVGKWPMGGPQRRVTDEHGRQLQHEDGRPVVERLPSTASVFMLHPGGAAVWVPLYCGSGRPQENDAYFTKISKEKLKKGFLPIEQCPKVFALQAQFHADFPKEKLHTPPCTRAMDGARIDEHHWCECIVLNKQLRDGTSAKLAEGTNARHRDKTMLDIDSRNKQTEALTEALQTVVEAVAQQKGGKK